MTKELEDAIRHIKTRADAWAVKEIEEALEQEPKYWIDHYGHVTPLVQPIRKGHWKKEVDFGNVPYYVCSECGVESEADTNFCFECGADMR